MLMLNRRKKLLVVLGTIIIFAVVASTLYVKVFLPSQKDGTESGQEAVILQSNAVVLDDIITDSIEKIKKDYESNPQLVYSSLSSAGSQKVYVGRDEEAIPYFLAAYDFAQNDEQRIGTETRIYNSAKKINDAELIKEYEAKVNASLALPRVTGSSQNDQ